jgi:DNA-binding beta-propeller fold protein YncE
VLFFLSGSTTATRVYGQGGSFTTGTADFPLGLPSASSLKGPCFVSVDPSTNGIYVTTYEDHRVLFFPSNSLTATRVYGQGDSFTVSLANNGGVTASSLNGPSAATADSAGGLYVADYANHRQKGEQEV